MLLSLSTGALKTKCYNLCGLSCTGEDDAARACLAGLSAAAGCSAALPLALPRDELEDSDEPDEEPKDKGTAKENGSSSVAITTNYSVERLEKPVASVVSCELAIFVHDLLHTTQQK